MCPAVSKSQQRLMGMVYAYENGDLKLSDIPNRKLRDKIKNIAKSLNSDDVKDFATTKHSGLPEKVKEIHSEEEKLINIIREVSREVISKKYRKLYF